MFIKIIGALLVITGCGGFGIKLSANYLKQIHSIRQLKVVLEFIYNELNYRLATLPELCKSASEHCKGELSLFFITLKNELEAQISPDVERCVSASLYKHSGIPRLTVNVLLLLGLSLGRFDLSGQLNGIKLALNECDKIENNLSKDKDIRVRNYRTLALCAGAALAILFI